MTEADRDTDRRVVFAVGANDDGSHPDFATERMWASATDKRDVFVLDNVPAFATGVAFEDVITVEERDGELWFARLIKDSGHSSLRVEFVQDTADVKPLRVQLREMGCSSEAHGELRLLAVDVPPEVDYSSVVQMLEEGESRGEWTFEELAVRSPIGKRDVQAARSRYASAMLGRDITWRMPESPYLGVFISKHLWDGGEPLLKVEHYDDGDWMFHGSTELSDDTPDDDIVYGHLAHVVDRFPEIQDLADLPNGYTATRSAPGEPFVIAEMPPDETDPDV